MNFVINRNKILITGAPIEISLITNQFNSQVTTELPQIIKYQIMERRSYYRACELIIQNELETMIIMQKAGTFPSEAIVRAFPYENLFKQIFTELMIYMLPFFLVISLFTTVSGVLKVLNCYFFLL